MQGEGCKQRMFCSSAEFEGAAPLAQGEPASLLCSLKWLIAAE